MGRLPMQYVPLKVLGVGILGLVILINTQVLGPRSTRTKDTRSAGSTQKFTLIPVSTGNIAPFCSATERLMNLQKMCRRLTEPAAKDDLEEETPLVNQKLVDSNTVVDTTHKLLISFALNTARPFWTGMFSESHNASTKEQGGKQPYSLNRELEYLQSVGLKRLKSYSTDKQKEIIHTYIRILVVQHPLTQLVSMYESNYRHEQGNKYNSTKEGIDFIHKLRHTNKVKSPSKPHVGFAGFVSLVLSKKKPFIPELAPMSTLIHPCETKYHFIIKLETMANDLQPLKTTLGMNVTEEEQQMPRSVAETLPRAYSVLDQLSMEQLKELIVLIKKDMRIFGYSLDATPNGLLVQCKYLKSSKMCC